MTVIKNESNSIPISLNKKIRVGLVSLGVDNGMTFHKHLNDYRNVEKINISDFENIRDVNNTFDKIIISIHKSDQSPFEKYKLSKNEISIINSLKKNNNVVLVVFSNIHYLILT